jgi:hypothetical protein
MGVSTSHEGTSSDKLGLRDLASSSDFQSFTPAVEAYDSPSGSLVFQPNADRIRRAETMMKYYAENS